MPRTFTPTELASLTNAQYSAMSPADRDAYDNALTALWADNYTRQCMADNVWDGEAASQGIIEP